MKQTRSRGDGLHRKKYGVWYFTVLDPQTGRIRAVSTRTKHYQEARTERTRYMERHINGKLPTDQAKWSIEDAVDHLLRYVDATAHPRTAKWKRTLGRPIIAYFGKLRLDEINPLRLKSYQAWRAQMPRRGNVRPRFGGPHISADTINRELAKILIPLLREARLWDPLKATYRPLRTMKRITGIALTVEQESRLLQVLAANPRWQTEHWATRLALRNGMRGEEIKGLRIGDIQLGDKPAVSVPRDITKTDAGERRIPLSPDAAYAVTRLLELAAAKGAAEPEHFLLPGDLSKHTKREDPRRGKKGFDAASHQESFATAWRKACTAAGVPGLRFHDLRHTFITRCAENGVPIEKVMAIVGHMSPEMTRYYTHLCDSTLRDVVDLVEASAKLPARVIERMPVASADLAQMPAKGRVM
jgi:integrase